MKNRIALLALLTLTLTAHATTATVTKTVHWDRELWEPRVHVTRYWGIGWWEDYKVHDSRFDIDYDRQVLRLVEKTSECEYYEWKQDCSEPVTTTWTSHETSWDNGNVPPGGEIANRLQTFCNGVAPWLISRNDRSRVPNGINADTEAERYFSEIGNTLQVYDGPEPHGPEIYPPGKYRFRDFGYPYMKRLDGFTDPAGNFGFLCMEMTAAEFPQFTISRK